ncbi:MAG: hypothetical protein JW725_01635 [Candidatus Babeliaceae bacterium]|nr:hypothetical protein [Candidatus Babeliaceae bacterium]
MNPTWTSIIPPLLVLVTAALTKRVIASLALGIVTASIIVVGPAPIAVLSHLFNALTTVLSDLDRIYLFLFLGCLGTIIELITHMGGVSAYTQLLRSQLRSKRAVETSSLMLSLLFFIDDFLNSLITGAIMRPLTDAYKIPRVKLAFLLNAMSSALCVLIPASTWGATILAQLNAAGISDEVGITPLINGDPLIIYLTTIPFVFYAIFIIGSAWFIVRRQLSFGSMHQQEIIAEATGNLFGGKKPLPGRQQTENTQGSLASFLVPISIFICAVIGFILWTGGSWLSGGTRGIVETLKNANTTWSLLAASIVTLITITLLMFAQKRKSVTYTIGKSAVDGFMLMKDSLIVLVLAFTFGYILNTDLQTGSYIAQLISTTLPLFILPFIIFVLASATTASTGSSWGTIAVLMPLTIKTLASLATTTPPLIPANIPLFFASLGALLAGSVAGAHFSPITDATVVTAMSAGAYQMDHVRTLMSYATPALIGSCIAFLITGLTYQWGLWTSYAIAASSGAAITIGMLLIRNWRAKRTTI